MDIGHILNWFLNSLLLVVIGLYVYSIYRNKKILNEFVETHNNRANILSRENNKLREQNEMFKERLRNCGISDFDVM